MNEAHAAAAAAPCLKDCCSAPIAALAAEPSL
jgi:hypothetical protein